MPNNNQTANQMNQTNQEATARMIRANHNRGRRRPVDPAWVDVMSTKIHWVVIATVALAFAAVCQWYIMVYCFSMAEEVRCERQCHVDAPRRQMYDSMFPGYIQLIEQNGTLNFFRMII